MVIAEAFQGGLDTLKGTYNSAMNKMFGMPVPSINPMNKEYPTTLEIGMTAVGVPVFDHRLDTLNLRIPRQYLTLKQIDALFSSSDVAQTILRVLEDEIFRNGFDIKELFQYKCEDCGKEFDEDMFTCDECKGRIKTPNWVERKKLTKWLPGREVDNNVNRFKQNLRQVLKQAERDLNKYDNSYIFLQKGYVFGNKDGLLKAAPVKEIYRASPYWMRKIYSSHGLSRDNSGQWAYACVNHRYELQWKKLEGTYFCPTCNREMFKVEYGAKEHMTEDREAYYVSGEIYHMIKYEPGPGYGVSRMFVLWVKLLTLYQMDRYIWKMFSLQRSPRGLLFLRGKKEEIQASWLWMRNMARENPNMIYPVAVNPAANDKSKNIAQYVDLAIDFGLMQFIETRTEFRTTIGMVYGVEPVFQGDLSTSGGLNNEGLQVTVTNRAMAEGQNVWNEFFLWFSYQLGVYDLSIVLNPSEEKDKKAQIEREGLRMDNAHKVQGLGFDIDIKETDDGIDFKVGEKDESLRRGAMGGIPGMMGGGGTPSGMRMSGSPQEAGQSQAYLQGFDGQPEVANKELRKEKKTIAIDLDGVLAEYDGWKGIEHIGKPIPGAKELIERLLKYGDTIIINTTRTSPEDNKGYTSEQLVENVKGWLQENGFPENVEIWSGEGKPGADIYIDDRALKHEPNTPWDESAMNAVFEELMQQDPSLKGVTYNVKKQIKTAPKKSIVAGQEYESDPSEAQIESGVYKKPRARYNGDTVVIENPVGGTRSGTDSNGEDWKIKMKADYGYILGTKGADKEHLDVFIKPKADGTEGPVFVIDQVDTETKEFDEHKIMFGYRDLDDAKAGYLANYEPGWTGLGEITQMTAEEWKEWKSNPTNLKEPVAPKPELHNISEVFFEDAEDQP